MNYRAGGLSLREREAVRTAISLWRNMAYSNLNRMKEYNSVETFLWFVEEEIIGFSVGVRGVR